MQENAQKRMTEQYVISVTGEGSVSILPDKVNVVLGVRTDNQIVQTAQAENAAAMQLVINALLQVGIQRGNIQTADYRIDPIYSYEDGEQLFKGYRVIHLLRININPELAGLAVDTAVQQGANEISSIQFTLSDSRPAQLQALSLAVSNARQKAEVIARVMGVSLYQIPLSVNEKPSEQTSPIPFIASLEKSSDATTPLEPGKMEVKAFVDARYKYVYPN
ncbi:SIMPL domain-containing protein [Mesobacillus harenae]|uniref:SIMPL domain-containing protein n=1 Tax=Mesobacillus harenae TaxID=2213203 RepID=UPI0015807459|nr:SIMPL domain-containing protein [Mesobacillus harenae]